MARILKGYIFAWTRLNDFAIYENDHGWGADKISENSKQYLQNKESLGINEVEIFTDKSK